MPSPFTKPDLLQLGQTLLKSGPVKTLPTPKRIRILFNGVYVADTTSALYVWEHPGYPYYYVPYSALRGGHFNPATQDSKDQDLLRILKLTVGDRSTDRLLRFGDAGLPEQSRVLAGMVRFEFSAADAWFEEDTRVYVHPKDPFKRVDIIASNRPVKVYIDGTLVASAASSQHLYETGLPCRYYLPPTAVDQKLLRASSTQTQCPYKGVASYYDVVLGEGEGKTFKDVIWYYRTPTHESSAVTGLLCFYNEKVDIELDGKMLERPKTQFS